MASHPKMAALIHNDGMEPTIPLGSVAVAEYPTLTVERWQIIAYRSQLTVDQAVRIAARDSAEFAKMSNAQLREFYTAHFEAFGALRINRIGRVVGLSGETVHLTGSGIIIDGEAIRPPAAIASLYQQAPAPVLKTFEPTEVPEHQIFVLQDNLAAGNDSRTLGTVKLTSVLGTLHDLLLPDEVSAIVAGKASSKVPSDLLEDLEEQHGPASTWGRPN